MNKPALIINFIIGILLVYFMGMIFDVTEYLIQDVIFPDYEIYGF